MNVWTTHRTDNPLTAAARRMLAELVLFGQAVHRQSKRRLERMRRTGVLRGLERAGENILAEIDHAETRRGLRARMMRRTVGVRASTNAGRQRPARERKRRR